MEVCFARSRPPLVPATVKSYWEGAPRPKSFDLAEHVERRDPETGRTRLVTALQPFFVPNMT